MVYVGPMIDISSIAFLNDSLRIISTDAKNGKPVKNDVHHLRVSGFCKCLEILSDTSNPDYNINICDSKVSGVPYTKVQSKLIDFHQSMYRKVEYSHLLEGLIETNQGLLEGKIVGDIKKFDEMIRYLI